MRFFGSHIDWLCGMEHRAIFFVNGMEVYLMRIVSSLRSLVLEMELSDVLGEIC